MCLQGKRFGHIQHHDLVLGFLIYGVYERVVGDVEGGGDF